MHLALFPSNRPTPPNQWARVPVGALCWLGVVWISGCLCCRAAEAKVVLPEFKPAEARTYLQTVLEAFQSAEGTDADAGLLTAQIRGALGEKAEAERLARRALEVDPRRADIQMFLAGLYIFQDRMEEAAGCVRRALAADPEVAGGQYRLGIVLDRLGDREGARKALELAVQQAPTDASARLVLGRLLLDQGQAAAALPHLERACQLDPKLSGAFYARFQAQRQLGAAEAAGVSLQTFHELKQAEKVELDTRNTRYDDERFMRALTGGFHIDVAEFYLRKQRLSLAEAHFRQAVRIDPEGPRGYEALAGLLVQTRRLSEARELYEALVRLKPAQSGYHANLGTTLLQLGDSNAALQQLQRALELDPGQPEALRNLARFYLGARRDLPEALNLCRRLVELKPTAANYDLLGWAFYANGQIPEALAAGARAVELEPTNAVYRDHYQRLQAPP